MLAGAGYAWDSSLAAAQELTHFPFLLTRGRAMDRESRIVELPMTFEDEDPVRGKSASADEILRVLRQVSADEGVVVWQSRPTAENRARLTAVLDGLPGGVKVGPLGPAARWWSARERVRFWTETRPGSRKVLLRLTLPPQSDDVGLSFEASSAVHGCRSLSAGVTIECPGRVIRLIKTNGALDATLEFELE